MQQIGKELRGQTIDPLDPGLRSRILATVREITPGPAAPAPSRRPVLIWGGAAGAALLAVAVFASHPRFAADYQQAEAPLAASRPAASAPVPFGYSPQAAGKYSSTESDFDAATPAQSRADTGKSFAGPRVSKAKAPNQEKPTMERGVPVTVLPPPRPQAGGASVSVNRPEQTPKPIFLERAGFDLNGYQFVAQGGRRIAVPFKKSLNAIRFARAADGRMALAESASSPILYLTPADTLVNAAIPASHWQPLPPGISSAQALYVRPARDWEEFTAMRWYPNMTVVGGFASADPGNAAFTWLTGSHVQIGGTLYPDFAAYRAFADAHPAARRLHAVYDVAPASAPAAMSPALPQASKPARSLRSKPRR